MHHYNNNIGHKDALCMAEIAFDRKTLLLYKHILVRIIRLPAVFVLAVLRFFNKY